MFFITAYARWVVQASVGLLRFSSSILLMRIHSRNSEARCTCQKVFHIMIGSSNLGYLIYFVLTLVAACKGWSCWSYSCGFIVMAFNNNWNNAGFICWDFFCLGECSLFLITRLRAEIQEAKKEYARLLKKEYQVYQDISIAFFFYVHGIMIRKNFE